MTRDIKTVLSKQFLGALLIGGTATGAGMLALPVATAGAGILPSYFIYFLSWLFSVLTGCLFIELSSWLPKNANLITMSETFLGKVGKWAVLLLYVFQFYLLNIAYVSEGSKIVIGSICSHIPFFYGVIAFTSFFGLFIILGAKVSSRLNALLMTGLIFTFLLFITVSSNHSMLEKAHYWGWKYAVIGLPVAFISFSYQGVIPTLYNYLDQDAKKTRTAMIFGTLIPLFGYIVWDYLIKGIVPVDGLEGLHEAKRIGDSAVQPLIYAISDSRIFKIGRSFAFFALTTSFIGVSLSMVDFFADFLKVKAVRWNRVFLAMLIYIPVVAVVLINPRVFIIALTLAGGFGSALLLGLLPIILVWIGRRSKKYSSKKKRLFGGNYILILLLVALICEISIGFAALRM